MSTPVDLQPAARALATVVAGVRDDQLADPTPCTDSTVAALLDHADGLALGLAGAGRKDLEAGSQQPVADATALTPDWRQRIPARLDALVAVWRDPSAWTGMTRAGGLDMPAEVIGYVTVDELVVHAWDLAVATGQSLDVDPTSVEAALSFARQAVAEAPQGTPGLFGPPHPVGPDAPPLHQLLALTGRNPHWRP